MGETVFSYDDAVNVKCDCCGRMIPAQVLWKEVKGRKMKFCSEGCYELYMDYKLGEPVGGEANK